MIDDSIKVLNDAGTYVKAFWSGFFDSRNVNAGAVIQQSGTGNNINLSSHQSGNVNVVGSINVQNGIGVAGQVNQPIHFDGSTNNSKGNCDHGPIVREITKAGGYHCKEYANWGILEKAGGYKEVGAHVKCN